LFSKDVIKEAHAEVFGARPPDGRAQREWNRMFGAAANSTMWALLADSGCGAVLESTWPAGETWPFVQAGLSSARVERPLQIWCEVPLALARERYALRHPSRHPVHGDPPDGAEWEQRWAVAEPLPIHDTLRVDTGQPVDLDVISDWCTRPGGGRCSDAFPKCALRARE
jgi:glucokinase